MHENLTIFEQLPYILRLGLNISIARRFYADTPLTQKQLAAHLGRSQHYVSAIERGVVYPTVEELEIIAKICGLKVVDIKPCFYD